MDRRSFLNSIIDGTVDARLSQIAADNANKPVEFDDKCFYYSTLAHHVEGELCDFSPLRTSYNNFEKLSAIEMARYAAEVAGTWFFIGRDSNNELILKQHPTQQGVITLIPNIETSTVFEPTFVLQKDAENLLSTFLIEEDKIASMLWNAQEETEDRQIVVFERCGICIAATDANDKTVAWHGTGYAVFV